jgi:predicted glycoside hydrolase/deacetylase ChbG (UPF0249 family)
MVRYPAAEEAAAYAQAHPALSVGLHFETGEWRFRDGEWYSAYEVVRSDDATAVKAALERQVDAFSRLLGRPPTHLDSHQHVHQSEPTRTVMLEASERLGIPLRGCDSAISYNGNFYGQTGEGAPFPEGISEGRLREMISNLAPGWTEFGCHVGYFEDLDSVYRAEREEELRVLCSDEARAFLAQSGVQLRSFADLSRVHGEK